jgi:hypothetical protein
MPAMRVVVEDDIDELAGRVSLDPGHARQPVQEADEPLVPMSGQRLADQLPFDDSQRRKQFGRAVSEMY